VPDAVVNGQPLILYDPQLTDIGEGLLIPDTVIASEVINSPSWTHDLFQREKLSGVSSGSASVVNCTV